MFDHILVPFDFSPGSEHALALAVRLARAGSGTIQLLHVGVAPVVALGAEGLGVSPILVQMNDRIAAEQREALDRAGRASIPTDVSWHYAVREGYPPDVIVEEAADHDVIVMGTHGRTGLGRALLGSVTERVLRAAPVPVLVTR